MVYPSGFVSHERHPMAIFQEWEAMGLFDIVTEEEPKVDCAIVISAMNSSPMATNKATQRPTKPSTPPPENISKDTKHRVSYVSKAAWKKENKLNTACALQGDLLE